MLLDIIRLPTSSNAQPNSGTQAQGFKPLPDTVRLKHLNDSINGNGLQQPALRKKDRAVAHQADSLCPYTWLHKGH